MDYLYFDDVSFLPSSSIRRLCDDLNNIVGQGILCDTFQVQNTEWLWLVNDIVRTMNSDKVLCGCFELYPSYVAGILNSVKEIHLYLLCIKQVNYAYAIENASQENIAVLITKHCFLEEKTLTLFLIRNYHPNNI